MALRNKTSLSQQADLIRNADQEGFNTAERVGRLFEDIINEADASLASETQARESRDRELQSCISAAQSNVNEIQADLKNLDDVLEFGGIFEGITSQNVGTPKKSTDTNCKVIYDKTNERFVLAVRKSGISDEQWGEIFTRPIGEVPGGVTPFALPSVSGLKVKPTIGGDGVIDKLDFTAFDLFDYYGAWLDADLYMSGATPRRGKVYIDTTNEKTYRFDGTALALVGSSLEIGETAGTAFDGARGKALDTTVANHTHQIEELYADSASQQANIADHTSKLTELYEAAGSLWANIDDLKGVDAVQASKIADLETGSTNLAAAIQAVRETAEGAQTSANANAAAIDSLLGANASTAIENFNEIIQFLDGVKDDESLIRFLNELRNTDTENASQIATHTTQIEALQSTAAEYDQQLAELATDAAAQRVCNEEHDTRISSLEERQSDCVWVLPFAFIFDSSPTEGSTVDFSLATAPSGSEIVFDLATNCFYAYTSALSLIDGAPKTTHTLFMKWEGCERYQRDGEPRHDCIYVSEENRLYRFDGTTFALVGSSLEIGTVSGTAFDGARGEALESAIGALTTQVADNTSQVADHATQLSQQFAKLSEIETAADAMQTAIEALQGVDVDHQQQINEALRDIDTVKGNVNGHDSRITALEGMQNDIAEIRQLVQETKTLAEQVLGASQGYNHEWIEAQD